MRRYVLPMLVLAILGGIAVGLMYKGRHDRAPSEVSARERAIRGDLPIGTPRSRVESYLDEQGIPHSYVERSNGSPESDNTEVALIRGVSKTWLVRRDIQIVFKFDDQASLREVSFSDILTGP
jgi:hypothetical protein